MALSNIGPFPLHRSKDLVNRDTLHGQIIQDAAIDYKNCDRNG